MSMPPERSRTPARRGRSPPRRQRTREVVVERIVEKVAAAGPANYPVLTKTNYNDWSLLMNIKLKARCLWNAIDPGDVELHVNRMALDAICSAVPPEMISSLATKPSAKDAWESLKTMRVGDDRIRKASTHKARREYELLAFRDGESVEDFAMRLTGIVNQLAILGDPEPYKKVVEKYLRMAKPRFKQLVLSIETLLDISALSLEEVTGRLKAAEDDEPPPSSSAGGKLYLTEEQWLERYKKKEQEEGHGVGGSGGRGKWRGRGGGKNPDGGLGSGTKSGRHDDKCRNCGKAGHWAFECRSKPKKEEQAHVAQEEETTLLLAHVNVELTGAPQVRPQLASPTSSSGGARSKEEMGDGKLAAPRMQRHCNTRDEVHLIEQEVLAALGEEEDRAPRQWVLETGATNHMTGSRSAFSSIDAGVAGSVQFGDGSIARIEGCGMVLYECKNGEHWALTNVYYLPRLTANIISVGQLDEDSYDVHIKHGVMRIRDEHDCLLAKMGREELVHGLPVLEQVEQLCEACLAGKHWRVPFPQQAQRRASRSLELVHGDLCGPITLATPSGNRYFLLLIDDYSRYMWVSLLPTKDGAPTAIKRIQAATERKSDNLLGTLCMD
ncbi:hypothetical protein U9M48_002110 [Paspalum notatum var. saurae]|uniref:Uncharacterized protein n=1 Tax=Paspalum notatum var. saurae TaxID=547442 RepID=A0AAQ3PKF6_PASNO